MIESHLDDRIYFHGFKPNTTHRESFEIVLRFPFKKAENDDQSKILIRRIQKIANGRMTHALDVTKVI